MKTTDKYILAFREEFGYLTTEFNDLEQKEVPSDNREVIENWLTKSLEEVRSEALKEVDRSIWVIIEKHMKHIDDGIYDFKEPNSVFLADNIKNDLKNITFKLELKKE